MDLADSTNWQTKNNDFEQDQKKDWNYRKVCEIGKLQQNWGKFVTVQL